MTKGRYIQSFGVPETKFLSLYFHMQKSQRHVMLKLFDKLQLEVGEEMFCLYDLTFTVVALFDDSPQLQEGRHDMSYYSLIEPKTKTKNQKKK